MLAIRKLSPGGYEYLTGSVACADRDLEPGETLAEVYIAHGYPPGQWYGSGAAALGVSGEVTAEQMQALFAEGRHPNASEIEAREIAAGASPAEAMRATKLGRAFAQYGGVDELASKVIAAYKTYNQHNGRPLGAPIDEPMRAEIRRRVQRDAFTEAHDGRKPLDDDELTRWLAEQKRQLKTATAGYELVIAPPKSVSVAWALADDHDREQITSLHRQAVRDTLDYVESHAAFTRQGDQGEAQLDTRGIVAALFEHWDSRAADPHLHSHVVISGKVQRDSDGAWRALDGRTMHAAAVTLSEYYNSRIRDLFRDQGASWSERPHNGIDYRRPTWELDAVPNELMAGFAQRASQVEQDRARRIVEYRRAHGREPSPRELLEISRRAQYGTREAKQPPRTLAEHIARWRAQAETMVPEAALVEMRQRLFATPEPVSEFTVAELAERTRFVVSDFYSHFNTWNLLAEAHRQTAHLRVPASGRDALVAQVVEAIIAAPDTISLQAPGLFHEPSELVRASGESVFVEHHSQRFTTEQTLREEAALAAWGQRADGVRINSQAVHQALAGAKLNPGQRRAVVEFAQSGRRIQQLSAPAGAGKTTTMKVFAQAWRAGGGRVYAFGPSARAAQELGDAIGARPHTLHQVTTALKVGVAARSFNFRRGDVLIVDEIGMAGTHTLHAVVEYALRRGADVRWVGDNRQLAAVEAGGAMRWFEHKNGSLRLREVVRFADRAQAVASLKLHRADPSGLDYYFEREWVQGGSRETMRDAAHRAWRRDLEQGRQTLLVVPTTDDVTNLNLQAREIRVARGEVDTVGRAVQLHDATVASEGDWVVTRENDRLTTLFGGRDFLKNGDTWWVDGVRRNGDLLLRHRITDGRVVLPAAYVRVHVELAYATTINRAQGMSVKKGSAHALIPQGISREQLYTMLTRAEFDNRAYVEIIKHVADSHQETPPERTARGVLEAGLKRSSAETPASEELRRGLNQATAMPELFARHQYVAHLGADERVEQALTTHVPSIPESLALHALLRAADDLGWHPDQLLAQSTSRVDFARADNPAGLLHHLLTQRLQGNPPPRMQAATATDIRQWREVVRVHTPTADVEDPAWTVVWKRAAAGVADGLDADTAVHHAAQALAARPVTDPMPDYDFVADALSVGLDRQRGDGAGWQPVLPWQARLDLGALSPELTGYLNDVQDRIRNRLDELRDQVTADPPQWIAALGPRPEDHETAAQWDDLAGVAAAYRETYTITSNDPAHPLGAEPAGPSLRATAWHDLISRWGPPTAPSSDTPPDAVDRLRDELDPDELLAAISQDKALPDVSLSTLLQRHRHLSTELLDRAATHALSEHAPHTLDADAAPALLAALRRAEHHGWQVDRLVATVARSADLSEADDPAALLHWHIHQHIDGRTPPARAADPTTEQMHRWRALAAREVPNEPVADAAWNLVWRHAAAAAAEGLNADAAITFAAQALATRPVTDPMEAHRYVAQCVVDLAQRQRLDGHGQQPVLPWMRDPAATVHAVDPERAAELHDIAELARTRLTQLRDQVTTEPPHWTAGLGPRPANPETAQQWDQRVVLAAAYRETYRVTSNDPQTPLGVDPGGNSARATAWRAITEQWRPPVDPDSTAASVEAEIEELRDRVDERRAVDSSQDTDERFQDRVDEKYGGDDESFSHRTTFGTGY
ncbi:relaxase domain-containing protein [Saccharopolyspora sp. K220]|uniref:MobF family relaxase n=1 Tax=Saccharopolyspora soli TaxID=2926618 RepID=UPI001F583990|nr:MobF family relaxase [Saccharopolyspora soli]MCI2422505.1 relaxase domain-containing protein [Saccharopolyspora soli]